MKSSQPRRDDVRAATCEDGVAPVLADGAEKVQRMERFGLSPPELLIIAILAVLLLGPTRVAGALKRLPELLRSFRPTKNGPPRPRRPTISGRSDRGR